MRSLILALALLVITTGTVVAQEVGELYTTKAYCMAEADVKKLATALAAGDDAKYHRSMADPEGSCVRLPGSAAVLVKLTEKRFYVVIEDGRVLEFWKVTDMYDVTAYAWIFSSEPGRGT